MRNLGRRREAEMGKTEQRAEIVEGDAGRQRGSRQNTVRERGKAREKIYIAVGLTNSATDSTKLTFR